MPKQDQNIENTRNSTDVEGNGNAVLQGVNANNIQITINNFAKLNQKQQSLVKQELLNWLAKNQLKNVFDQLNQVQFKPDDQNVLILLQAQWSELEHDKLIGVISRNEQTQQTNIIRSRLIQFIQSID